MKPSEALAKYGSDKVLVHSYGRVYDALLEPGTVTSLLEVGVQTGASLRAWHECLPRAAVYGLDIRDTSPDLPADRCRFERIDATDPVQVARVMLEWGVLPGSLDVVVEDAAHSFRDQIATYYLLWDYVAPGGWYVIEDVEPWTPLAPFIPLGGVVYDLRGVKGRHDDVMILFQK